MRIHYIKRAALSLCAAMSLGLSATSQVSQSVTTAQNAQAFNATLFRNICRRKFFRKLYNHRQQSRRNKMGALFWEGTNLLQLRIGDGRLVDYPGTEPRRR